MKILAIVGKVDSRILVYPLARALSLVGSTGIITDDGAYRRLYFGQEDQGTINGIDVSIGIKGDEKLRNSLSDTGVNYDYLIVVTTGYVPKDASGVIICKGIDKSMFSIEQRDDTEEQDIVNKKKKKGKTQEEQPEETKKERYKETKAPETDDIKIPDGIPSNTAYISFEAPPKKDGESISLKDIAMRYIYTCEERKELFIIDDKAYNRTIVKLAANLLALSQDDLFKLMTRKEYIKGGKVK